MQADDYMQAGESGEPADQTESSKESGEDMQETALVPTSLFGGDCKPGDKYTVEVVSKHDGELEVKWVKEDKEESDEKVETPDDAMASVDAGVAKMSAM